MFVNLKYKYFNSNKIKNENGFIINNSNKNIYILI